MIKLIINKWLIYHVSLDTVNEFENSILSTLINRRIIVKKNSKLLSKLSYKIYLFAKRLKIVPFFISKNIPKGRSDLVYFTILMGADLKLCLPYFFLRGSKNIFLFDAWASTHKKIIDFVNDFQVTNLFLSSSDAVASFKECKSSCRFHWIPEGINIREYKFFPFEKKYIDVIQIGRKYDIYHNMVVEKLKHKKKVYMFEKQKGEIIFSTREKFINGLASSKISICFPSNITHPERAAGIETMTVRYLQSIASKCLIVGKAPKEMIELFGYNPVIEADFSNPDGQLEDILLNYERYYSLIEKNYISLSNQQWSKRWEQIEEIIFG